MPKLYCLVALTLLGLPVAAEEFLHTEIEQKLINAGMAVVRHAQAEQLQVDIVVQPEAQTEAAPIAMAIKAGRCSLVLALRGNPAAEALLDSVPPSLFEAVAEAVFAHEIGHCWRYKQGAWKTMPVGFTQSTSPSKVQQEQAARREEGFADLVGLAWTQRTRPDQYASVLSWLEKIRHNALPGQPHDTAAWLAHARNPAVFDNTQGIFVQAEALWKIGLRGRSR